MRAIAVLAGFALLAVGCGGGSNPSDTMPAPPQCSDGLDNDGDGSIDFPDDMGCTSATDDSEDSPVVAQCQDGRDNDGDGKTDFPNDPGCFAAQADSETDDCPSGPNCPQCADGTDNDGNGAIDYPNDPGCASASDNEEFLTSPVACGSSLMLQVLPATHIVDGTLDATSTSQVASPCGGVGVPARGYVFHIDTPKVIEISTDDNATVADTIVDLRSSSCMDQAAEIACNDDIASGNSASKVTAALQPGTYFIIVSGVDSATTGAFHLQVNFFSGEGAACTTVADCGPGLVCRTPYGGSADVCSKPVCSDGIDDDGDGKIDYPNDPGCASPDGNDEIDECPTGPNCPACSDGIDNDNDGNTDYPADTTCQSAGGVTESCASTDGVQVLTQAVTAGTTSGQHNDFTPTCGSSSATAPDLTYRLDLPALTGLDLSVETPSYWDTVTALYDATCGGTAIKCSDPNSFHVDAVAAGTYYFLVDGYSSGSGAYTITVSGTIQNGGRCDGALAQSGALTCGPGYACLDASGGTKTCQPGPCGNGIDDDGDGKIDYPNDPGCSSTSDNDEADDCPNGPNCPECSDGQDNDGDGAIDYPNDTSCAAAGGSSESCMSTDGVQLVTQPMTSGTTTGQNNDFKPSCGSSTATSPDLTYRLDLPALTGFDVAITKPTSWDSVIALYNSTCGGTAITCSDPDSIHLDAVTAGTYYFLVDGYYSTSYGAFTFTVSGTIQNGGRCDGALAQSGALTCGPGYACLDASGGTKTCQPGPCNDNIDNDGDGKIDYPNDPGCMNISDNDETDDCPTGPNCPACGDGIDNDGDSKIDFPNDTTCHAASDASESCVSTDGVQALTQPMTAGNTTGQNNDVKPSCGSSSATAPDLTYRLDVPALTSLDLGVTKPSSSWDSVIALYDSTCGGTAIKCSDPDSFHLDAVAAGTYYFLVDGYSTASGAFAITVSGKIQNGGRCDGALAQSGALVCGAGYTCLDASGGTKTCQPALCSDGLDNDGDGLADYPADPGCDSPSDNTEEDPATLSVCSNHIDDDGDGQTDWPADYGCSAASSTSEVFCMAETDPTSLITTPTIMGTTVGKTHNLTASCGSSTSTAADVVYALSLPVPVDQLVVDTIGTTSGFDTIVYVKSAACGADFGCDDDSGDDAPYNGASHTSRLVLSGIAPGSYAVGVAGYGSSTSPAAFTLNVKGTVAPQTVCESPLFAAGVLACPTGTTCSGAAPMRCQ